MKIQRTQDIEGRLWAVQVIKQENVGIFESDEQSAGYRQGCYHGFKTTLQKIGLLFDEKSTSKAIWSRDGIKYLLLTVQMMTQQSPGCEAEQSDDYCRGFERGGEAALGAVATCFGVSLSSASPQPAGQNGGSRYTAWFLADDVKNMMAAMDKTLSVVGSDEETPRPIEYYEGFEAALRRVANSFGTHHSPLATTAPLLPPRDYWFCKSIEDKMLLIYQAAPTPGGKTEASTAYSQGFRAALHCIALALGLRNLS